MTEIKNEKITLLEKNNEDLISQRKLLQKEIKNKNILLEKTNGDISSLLKKQESGKKKKDKIEGKRDEAKEEIVHLEAERKELEYSIASIFKEIKELTSTKELSDKAYQSNSKNRQDEFKDLSEKTESLYSKYLESQKIADVKKSEAEKSFLLKKKKYEEYYYAQKEADSIKIEYEQMRKLAEGKKEELSQINDKQYKNNYEFNNLIFAKNNKLKNEQKDLLNINDDIKEKKESLEKINNELNKEEKKIKENEDDLFSLEKYKKEVENDIFMLEKKIETIASEIEENEKELEIIKEELNKQIENDKKQNDNNSINPEKNQNEKIKENLNNSGLLELVESINNEMDDLNKNDEDCLRILFDIFKPEINSSNASKDIFRIHPEEIYYSDKEEKLVVYISLSTYTNSRYALDEEIEAAASISVGDEIDYKLKTGGGGYSCDFYTKGGLLLAKSTTAAIWKHYKQYEDFVETKVYANKITFDAIEDGKGFIYPYVQVKLVIKRRKDLDKITEKDINNLSVFLGYDLDENTKRVYGINESYDNTILYIPEKICGKIVVIDGKKFFDEQNNKINEIVFEEGVEEIESLEKIFGYSGPQQLKRIVFPKSVNSLGYYFFGKEYINHEMIEKIELVVKEGSYAHEFFKSFDTSRLYRYGVAKPLFLTVIDNDGNEIQKNEYENTIRVLTFYNRQKGGVRGLLEENNNKMGINYLYIPNDICGKIIKEFDLYSIPSTIKKLVIPKCFEEFNGLYEDFSIEKLEIDEDNELYFSDGLALYSNDRKRVIRLFNAKIEEYSILEGTEIIARSAFSGRKSLKRVIIPDSVTSIERDAFYNCNNLDEVIGANGLQSVEKSAFENTLYYKKSLGEKGDYFSINGFLVKYLGENQEKLVLPSDITYMNHNVFTEITKIRNVVISNSIKGLRANCFPRVSEEFSGINQFIIDKQNEYYTFIDGILYSKDLKCLIMTTDKVNVPEIVIPEGVETIKEGAFRGWDKIERIELPSTLTYIDDYAFCDCISLKELDLKNTSIIGKGSFSNTSISKIQIPDNLSVIECNSFEDCKLLKDVVFGKKVKVIKEGAFRGTKLSKLQLPEGLIEIGENAFRQCLSLKKVLFPLSLKKIGKDAFSETKIDEICLPDGIEIIEEGAFEDTKIKNVVIPKSLRRIGESAFGGSETIEIYDSLEPEAKDCYEISSPNSTIGYIGYVYPIGKKKWNDYEIIVRSSQTDEIKFKLYLGSKDSQTEYQDFLLSAWGKNATFAFEELDDFFPDISGKEYKEKVAEYRLEYPIELSSRKRKMYETFLKKNKK